MERVTKKERKQKIAMVTGVLAAAFVLVFLVITAVKPDKSFSANENRNLETRHMVSGSGILDGSWMKGLTKRFSDQFLLRDLWISLKSAEDYLTGQRESHGVYIGKKGYLFATPETPDWEQVKNMTDAMNGFADKHQDLNVRALVVPCAASIYPELLPGNAPVRNQLSDLNGIQNSLGSDSKITFINPTQVLRDNKKDQLYYKTDHHWTSLGARRVFDSFASTLGIENPIEYYTRYILSFDFLGTLGSQSGHFGTRDMVSIYVPRSDVKYYVTYDGETRTSLYVSEKLAEKDQYQVFLGGNHAMVDIRTSANTGKNLLLFKDSYANSFVQFLLPYYDRIIMIDPRYYYDSIGSTVSQNTITDVLFLYSANTMFTDASLADCLNS